MACPSPPSPSLALAASPVDAVEAAIAPARSFQSSLTCAAGAAARAVGAICLRTSKAGDCGSTNCNGVYACAGMGASAIAVHGLLGGRGTHCAGSPVRACSSCRGLAFPIIRTSPAVPSVLSHTCAPLSGLAHARTQLPFQAAIRCSSTRMRLKHFNWREAPAATSWRAVEHASRSILTPMRHRRSAQQMS